MKLVTDTREQTPLVFPTVVGVEYVTQMLPTGDYSAWHGMVKDAAVVERKSLGDLFHAFTANYDLERKKILKAQELHLKYILAIEGGFFEVLKGYTYWAQGEVRESKKSGLAMIKQLMTLQRKYHLSVWFCGSRKEMAMRVQEYFLAQERVKG